jgi:predicted RNase H-like HicB family nuclease
MSKRETKEKKSLRAKEYRYTVFFEPLEEGGYNVVVPAIPEICTFGETLKEAREMARDAIRCYLESAMKTGEEIPHDVGRPVQPRKEQLAVTVA